MTSQHTTDVEKERTAESINGLAKAGAQATVLAIGLIALTWVYGTGWWLGSNLFAGNGKSIAGVVFGSLLVIGVTTLAVMYLKLRRRSKESPVGSRLIESVRQAIWGESDTSTPGIGFITRSRYRRRFSATMTASLPVLTGSAAPLKSFTLAQACRLTGATSHQLRYWDRIGLVKTGTKGAAARLRLDRRYSFRDLVAVRVIKSLLDNGMSVQRVRRAWDYLRRTASMDEQLAEVRLAAEGRRIMHSASDEGAMIRSLREGQLAFFVVIDEITREVEGDVTRFELDRDRFLEVLSLSEERVLSEETA